MISSKYVFVFLMSLIAPSVMAATPASPKDKVIIDSQSPRGSLIGEINAAASADAAGVEASLYVDGDQSLLKLVADVAVSKAKFGAAMVDHFGKDVTYKLGITPDAAREKISSGIESIQGDKAKIVFHDGAAASEMLLRKVEGKWRIPVSAVTEPVENAAPHEIGGRYIKISKVYMEMAAEVKAGQYPNAANALQTAQDRVHDAATGNDSQ